MGGGAFESGTEEIRRQPTGLARTAAFPTPGVEPELRDFLERILREVRDLRRVVEGRRCSDADLERLEALLPAVAGRFGSSPVTTRELRADAAIRATGPPSSRAFGALMAKAAHDGAVTSREG
jgi:hypothetical protein